ncbi:MAG TPA: hypothetical protein VND87_16820 [Stellaceae bacterium]|nr:hypothetical protein [Stellaceae bacterium]
MSVRENLLRLHRWRLQERQDYLAGLESLLERLRNDARRLEEEAAENDRDKQNGAAYLLFLGPLVERKTKIERSIIELASQIAEAKSAVNLALQEVKHAEVAMGPHAAANVPLRVMRRARQKRQGALRAMPGTTRPRGV